MATLPTGEQGRFGMRVIVIGGTGTIGSAVVKRLSTRHDVVVVGHKRGAFQVDLASPDSITSLFKAVGTCDAVVSTAGIAKFASLDDLTYDDYFVGLKNKLMGQSKSGAHRSTICDEPRILHPHQRRAQPGTHKRQLRDQYGQRGTGRICSRRCHRPAAKPARECRQPALGHGNTHRQRHGPVDRPACRHGRAQLSRQCGRHDDGAGD
jgi:hypothetical protein